MINPDEIETVSETKARFGVDAPVIFFYLAVFGLCILGIIHIIEHVGDWILNG